MSMRLFFYEYCFPCEVNSGQKHPDFDDTVVTDITDYYRRFAADPNFTVNMLPPVYDIKDESPNGTATDSLIECDEPEFGEQDLEYFDQLKRDKAKTVPPEDVPES